MWSAVGARCTCLIISGHIQYALTSVFIGKTLLLPNGKGRIYASPTAETSFCLRKRKQAFALHRARWHSFYKTIDEQYFLKIYYLT